MRPITWKPLAAALWLGSIAATNAASAAERSFAVAASPVLEDTYPERLTMFPQDVRGLADITYSVVPGFRPLILDLYLPKGNGPHPLVLYIHGGGWVGGHTRHSGALEGFPRVLASLAAEGFAVASIEYRLSGEAPFPAQLQDVRAALRYLRTNAQRYGIDAARVAAWGGSAGGHLAALLATSCGDTSLDPAPAAPRSECIQAAVTWYGVFDFAPVLGGDGNASRLLDCKGPCEPAKVARASPITYISGKSPPFLLIHGENDKTVDVAQSRLAEQRFKAAGVHVESLYMPGVDHSFIGTSAEQTRAATLKATNATFDFFHRQLGVR
jgi:acetyl esterase/lipase